jgi:hypothetical protein
MHIHGVRSNPHLQLNAASARLRAEARQEVERTRKKLLAAASSLAGAPDEGYVTQIQDNSGSEEDAPQQGSRSPDQEAQSPGRNAAEASIPSFSEYA